MNFDPAQFWHDNMGLLVGSALLVLSAVLIRMHRRSWRRWQQDRHLAEGERSFYRRQFRRRVQVAILLMVIGVMIAVGDKWIPWQRAPGLFTFYWMLIVVLALWIVMLAIGDQIAGMARARVAASRSRTRLTELRGELERIQRQHTQHKGNGRPPEQTSGDS